MYPRVSESFRFHCWPSRFRSHRIGQLPLEGKCLRAHLPRTPAYQTCQFTGRALAYKPRFSLQSPEHLTRDNQIINGPVLYVLYHLRQSGVVVRSSSDSVGIILPLTVRVFRLGHTIKDLGREAVHNLDHWPVLRRDCQEFPIMHELVGIRTSTSYWVDHRCLPRPPLIAPRNHHSFVAHSNNTIVRFHSDC
jgi:hypothetical protein